MEEDPDYPCNACDWDCDPWEARYCCTLCHYEHGDEEPDCEDCDPMDV